ncbi:MAG: DNA polymerase III subunit delta' [Rickettsiales bacterium]|jgi:DNA polymerase-3 subunit delta'
MAQDETAVHPRETHKLYGHGQAEASLHDACRAGRLHHSLIFAGPKGIGKATLAFRLARYLLKPEEGGLLGLADEGAGDFDMSPEDPIFRQVAASGHPSLRVIERARNADTGRLARDISIADIRALSDFYRLTSVDGGWRVAIIDPAEEMNQNAANALLKILEEPPEKCVIILISHAPGRLLPTIRSRCRTVHLSSLSRDDLTNALALQGVSPSGGDIELLMQLSQGSVGAAVLIERAGGLVLYREIQSLMARKGETFDRELDSFGDRLARNGQDEAYELFTRLMERAITDKITETARAGSVPSPGGELERWLDVWEKVRILFAQAHGLGLDRKHVILNAFLHVSGAVTGSAAR